MARWLSILWCPCAGLSPDASCGDADDEHDAEAPRLVPLSAVGDGDTHGHDGGTAHSDGQPDAEDGLAGPSEDDGEAPGGEEGIEGGKFGVGDVVAQMCDTLQEVQDLDEKLDDEGALKVPAHLSQ